MSRNFYHGKQADIVTGSANFASLISASPVIYGLTAGQATSYGTVDTALQSAYLTAITPETKTPVAIEAKNQAIRNMRAMAIPFAKLIAGTPTVSDAQLLALGLLPRNAPSPIPPAMDPPFVEVLSVIGRLVKVRIHATTPEGTRKPIGSAGAQIYSFVGPDAPTDPTQYLYQGLATRGTAQIQFPNTVASGATAWIAAQWISQRGTHGIACTPVQVTIQGGPILAEAA